MEQLELPLKVPVFILLIQEGARMQKSEEINRLGHIALEHIDGLYEIIKLMSSLSIDGHYLKEVLYVAEQNCSMIENKIIVACAITEEINIPPVAQ